MADVIQDFQINECKCSETGVNHAPLVYVDGTDAGRAVQFWFAPRKGVSHDELHDFISHMRRVLSSCHMEITQNEFAQRR